MNFKKSKGIHKSNTNWGIWKLKMNAATRDTKWGAIRATSDLPVTF